MSSDPLGLDAAARADDVAIRVRDVSKHYVMFPRPEDRFKQMVVPRLQRLVGRSPKRYFTDFAALSGVSFDINRGETVGIIGRNGSGKSTLLQIVCGTLRPTSGSVEVDGRIAALLELGAGFNPEFTGRENVFLNASILGVPRQEMEWRFDDIARFADIGAFIDQPVKTYSSGMYVRLAFATAINVDPDILVVDEALAVGDEAFQRKCFARIEEIKDRGGTILFVSHGAQTIVQLCTRALLFDSGELLLQGKPKTVVNQYQRLVNASPEAAAEIRNTILASDGAREETFAEEVEVGQAESVASNGAGHAPDQGGIRLEQIAEQMDYLDPNLRSQSFVSLEPRGARIRDLRMLTLNGETVNNVQLGKRYTVEYTVDFSTDSTEVGCGFSVRTVEGLALGGGQTMKSRVYRLRRVRSGDTAKVRFDFDALMLPGSYFVSCGVFGQVEGESIALHRLMDALMFKVAPENESILTGRVDLRVVPRIDINPG